MTHILAQPIAAQLFALAILGAMVACVAWTVTHEEIFREPREYCVRQSKHARHLLARKVFYVFTCEYCFSHYVTAVIVLGTGYRLLLDDWRGAVIGGFVTVWVANMYMSAFARLRLEVRLDRIEADAKEETNGNIVLESNAPVPPK